MTIDTGAIKEESRKKVKIEKKDAGFFGRLKTKAKGAIKEEFEFRKKVFKTRRASFKKAKITEAAKEGREQAKRRRFGTKLGSQLQSSKGVGPSEPSSNMERMMFGATPRETKQRKSKIEELMGY